MGLKELGKVLNIGEEITFSRNDKTVSLMVRELTNEDLIKCSKLIQKILDTQKQTSMTAFILLNVESFYEIASYSIGESVKDLKEFLTLDEFIDLASKVIEVNSNLFFSKILPKINRLTESLQQTADKNQLTTTGASQSNNSLKMDTRSTI